MIFKPHVSELGKCISDDNDPRLVDACLQGLAAVSRAEPEVAPNDKYVYTSESWSLFLTVGDRRSIERLMRYVRSTNHRHAKYAARVLCFVKDKEELCAEIVEVRLQ